MNNKQIQENRTMDAAIIFQGHNTLDNRHSLYDKIMKALDQLELDKDVTSAQQQVLTELRRKDDVGWTIKNKQHSYTDGQPNNGRCFTDGLIIVVKKPFIRIAREIFGEIGVRYPDCLGGGKRIISTGTGDVHGYKGYQAMMIRNNGFHNRTKCITIDGYHPNHQNL